MSYYQQLHPWCIVRLLTDMQRRVVVRLRKRNDAERNVGEHVKPRTLAHFTLGSALGSQIAI